MNNITRKIRHHINIGSNDNLQAAYSVAGECQIVGDVRLRGIVVATQGPETTT